MANPMNIPDFYQAEYGKSWEATIQQKQSVIIPTIAQRPFKGKSKEFKTPLPLSTEAKSGRFRDVVLAEFKAKNRWIVNSIRGPQEYPAFDYWDEELLKDIVLPKSETLQQYNYAMARDNDRYIIEQMEGTAYTGADAPTESIPLPSTQKIAHGDTGLTFSKVSTVIRMLTPYQWAGDGIHALISEYDQQYLIDNVNELRSKDFSNASPIDGGTLFGKTWMGITWHFCNELTKDEDNGIINCLFYKPEAVYFNPGKSDARIDVRPDKGYALQTWAEWMNGAVRSLDEGVIQVKTKYASI